MKHDTIRKLAAATALACAAYLPAAATPNLETFVMATNGQSGYSTYSIPEAVKTNFGAFGFGAPIPANAFSDPTALAADGISGFYRMTRSASAALLTDAASSSGTGLSVWGSWVYTGSTDATARYGQLKSRSSAVHTGHADNNTVNTAESYSIARETFLTTSPAVPNGTPGTMRLALTIDGSLSIVGTGSAGLAFAYSYGGAPSLNNILLVTAADIYGNGYQIYGPHSSLGSYTLPSGMGYTIGPLLPSGSPTSIRFGGVGTVYADVPIVFGASVDYSMGLMTFTDVGDGNGSMDSLFSHTATITGIQIFDNLSNEVTEFAIASGSGTPYDAQGVHLGGASAPEPRTLYLLLVGALSTGRALWRPHRSTGWRAGRSSGARREHRRPGRSRERADR